MKYRYLKISTSTVMFATDTLTKQDLAGVKTGRYLAIIDMQERSFYDAEENVWEVIEVDR